MRKSAKIALVAITLCNILLLAGAGWLLFHAQTQTPFNLRDISTETHGMVGFMRYSALQAKLETQPVDGLNFAYLGLTPGGDALYDTLQFRRTISRDSVFQSGDLSSKYKILWYCEEESCWYLIFDPCPMQALSSQELPAGEETVEYLVPHGLLAHPGRYGLSVAGLWNFEFTVS